jgi:hypothetical protein
VNRSENPSPMPLCEIGTQLGGEIIVGVVPWGAASCFEALAAGASVKQTMADEPGTSFVEMANRFSASEIVGLKFEEPVELETILTR